MSTQRTMTLREAAEWFRYRSPNFQVTPTNRGTLVLCEPCGACATQAVFIIHAPDCPYDAAVRAIEQAKEEVDA